jgi:hypothetical protein
MVNFGVHLLFEINQGARDVLRKFYPSEARHVPRTHAYVHQQILHAHAEFVVETEICEILASPGSHRAGNVLFLGTDLEARQKQTRTPHAPRLMHAATALSTYVRRRHCVPLGSNHHAGRPAGRARVAVEENHALHARNSPLPTRARVPGGVTDA